MSASFCLRLFGYKVFDIIPVEFGKLEKFILHPDQLHYYRDLKSLQQGRIL